MGERDYTRGGQDCKTTPGPVNHMQQQSLDQRTIPAAGYIKRSGT